MKITGRNAVSEALKSNLTIERLAVAKGLKDAQANRAYKSSQKQGRQDCLLDKEVLDKESKAKGIRAFLADVTDYKYSAVEDILQSAQEQNQDPLIIILDGVEDPIIWAAC